METCLINKSNSNYQGNIIQLKKEQVLEFLNRMFLIRAMLHGSVSLSIQLKHLKKRKRNLRMIIIHLWLTWFISKIFLMKVMEIIIISMVDKALLVPVRICQIHLVSHQ